MEDSLLGTDHDQLFVNVSNSSATENSASTCLSPEYEYCAQWIIGDCVPLHGEDNPLANSVGLSIKSDVFSLNKGSECLEIGDIANGFPGTTPKVSCVIYPLGLSYVQRLEHLWMTSEVWDWLANLSVNPLLLLSGYPTFSAWDTSPLSRSNL